MGRVQGRTRFQGENKGLAALSERLENSDRIEEVVRLLRLRPRLCELSEARLQGLGEIGPLTFSLEGIRRRIYQTLKS